MQLDKLHVQTANYWTELLMGNKVSLTSVNDMILCIWFLKGHSSLYIPLHVFFLFKTIMKTLQWWWSVKEISTLQHAISYIHTNAITDNTLHGSAHVPVQSDYQCSPSLLLQVVASRSQDQWVWKLIPCVWGPGSLISAHGAVQGYSAVLLTQHREC